MMSKKQSRLRRARKTRLKIKEIGSHRLNVHRTPRHIYAQVIAVDSGVVVASASTVQKDIKKDCKATGNVSAAKIVGQTVAEKAKKAGVTKVSFDRSGFKYHGRIKALADAARESGLEF